MWFVYILKCSDNSLYTGITTNLERRLEEHNSSPKGSKYTRARRPVQVVFTKEFENRSGASKEEALIKNLSRDDKFKLIK